MKKEVLINAIYTAVVVAVIYWIGIKMEHLISNIVVLPGNIIGMGILFVSLQFGLVKFDRIVGTGEFVLSHMSLFFIPFGVSIIKYYPLIKEDLISILVVLFLSTVFAMSSAAWVAEKVGD